MEKYIIKNNIPDIIEACAFKLLFGNSRTYKKKSSARNYFHQAETCLSNFNTKSYLRLGDIIRGTIQVEIDGFFYYVELYKEE